MKNKNDRIIILTLLSIIIILAVSVVILALRSGEQPDKRTDMQKYYDSKCQSYSIQNANLAKGQIVFIGDSITDLYILDDHYADLPLACYNRGIGGDTTLGVLSRLKVSLFDLNPSVVVLMIGTNDINGRLEVDGILERYEQIIDEINANLPDAQLYCMSIIPQNTQIEESGHIKIAETTPKIINANKIANPIACIIPSLSLETGFLLIHSIITKSILPPSSAGNGSTFITPRLIVRSAAILST